MNIALLIPQRVLAFLGTQIQHWASWVQPVGLTPARTGQENRNAPEFIADRALSTGARGQKNVNSSTRPLRIVRVLESGQGHGSGGRMVISGRMADVCAELDRLAAREAALT